MANVNSTSNEPAPLSKYLRKSPYFFVRIPAFSSAQPSSSAFKLSTSAPWRHRSPRTSFPSFPSFVDSFSTSLPRRSLRLLIIFPERIPALSYWLIASESARSFFIRRRRAINVLIRLLRNLEQPDRWLVFGTCSNVKVWKGAEACFRYVYQRQIETGGEACFRSVHPRLMICGGASLVFGTSTVNRDGRGGFRGDFFSWQLLFLVCGGPLCKHRSLFRTAM